jgi:hypothetical protein
MAATTEAFSAWLADARIAEPSLTSQQRAVLQAAFDFRHDRGDDYYGI